MNTPDAATAAAGDRAGPAPDPDPAGSTATGHGAPDSSGPGPDAPRANLVEGIRAAIDATVDVARRRRIRITLSAPARGLSIDIDPHALRRDFLQCLVDMLDSLSDGAALRIDVGVHGDSARVIVGPLELIYHLVVSPSPAAPMPPSTGPASPPATTGRLVGLEVLIADDNRDAANGLATLLRLAGAEARAVFDGQVAADDAIAHRPHAVVLDLAMPGVDGCEAARRIRQHDPGHAICLIALTGAFRSPDRVRALEAGFDHQLTKPVDMAALTALLARRG